MDEEDVFSADELKEYADQLVRIISEGSPVRDAEKYPGVIKRHGIVISPFPGNLKTNGNAIVPAANGYIVKHGYRPAPYALYANKYSRKHGYIQKAVDKFRGFLEGDGWEEE